MGLPWFRSRGFSMRTEPQCYERCRHRQAAHLMTALNKSVVVVVGSLHYDIMVDAPDRPRKGETVTGYSWRPKFGGKGATRPSRRRRPAPRPAWPVRSAMTSLDASFWM